MAKTAEEIEVLDLHPPVDEIRTVVLDGLSQSPKTLPCKLLYDERGSELFEQICELDEYYLTRTELEIFEQNLPEMSHCIGPQAAIVEYGSGSSMKSRMLLESLDDPVAYIPIDISREMLCDASMQLNDMFPQLEVLPVCADYTQTIQLPKPTRRPKRHVVFFPGSTIGNFHMPEAEDFLRRSGQMCGSCDGLLIGFDLKKDRETVELAYNDPTGVTASFTTNILRRINREVGTDFDLDQFQHRAVWNEPMSRIEVYLVSQINQSVQLNGTSIQFQKDEPVRIEVSYKYDPLIFAAMAERAGYKVNNVWTDRRNLFSVQYLEVK